MEEFVQLKLQRDQILVWFHSLSTYAKINKYGFIESPYKRVKDGVVEEKVEYLSAMEETKYTIAQANSKVDNKWKNHWTIGFV